jgi:hypothetical protein
MHEPISFRNGIDGTAAVARVVLEKEPMICGGQQYVAAIASMEPIG